MTAAAAPAPTPKDPVARFKAELDGLEATARERLKGTRALAFFDRLPTALEGELDAVLKKVGLMRVAKLTVPAPTPVVAEEASEQAAPDVDVATPVAGA